MFGKLKTRSYFLVVLFGCFLWLSACQRQKDYGPDEVAPDEPIQISIDRPYKFKKDEYLLTPLAEYEITARVLLRSTYWLGREADLSPLDLTLAWGPLSAQRVLEKINFSMSHRYYNWHAKELPLASDVINSHVANVHLIPANDAIESRLMKIDVSDIAHLKGFLVRVEASDGWRWESSLSRTDSGRGACELMWVESAEVR